MPFPSPADLADPGIELVFPALAGGLIITELPGKPMSHLRSPKLILNCMKKTIRSQKLITGIYIYIYIYTHKTFGLPRWLNVKASPC